MFAFISGATGGIGKAFSFQSAKEGYDLFLTGRSIGKLSSLKTEIQKIYKVRVEVYACDVTDENMRNKMISYIDELNIKFSRILNVAGVDIQKGFLSYTKEKLLFQLRVNAEATVMLTYDLLNRREEKAELLAVSSMSGVSPMPYFALYSATKAMLTNLFTSLHYELKKSGVKVTVVLPGGVYTRPDVIEDIKGQGLWGKLSAKTPEYVAEKSIRALKKNKTKYIPGFFNKFLYCVMKVAPKKIVLSFIAKRWQKQTKDAF